MAIPSNVALPTVTGTPIEGYTLIGTPGEWTGNPTSYTIVWRHSDFPPQTITGATGWAYTLTRADVGHNISYRVAATNADGTSAFAVASTVFNSIAADPNRPPDAVLTAAAPEEERAALFRQQCVNRLEWRAQQAARLQGDPVAAAAVRAAWEPLLPAAMDAWDCPDPIEPARPAWADRVPGEIELPEYIKRA